MGSTHPPRLLDQVSIVCRRRHLSPRTEDSYRYWIRQFIYFHGKRHPNTMGGPEVEAFLNHLASERHLSASSQTQALNALVFLYDSELHQPLGEMAGLKRMERRHRVPVVLSREEVKAILEQMTGVVRLMAELIYGSGLRVNECMTLRVKDIDFSGGVLNVRSGKGGKDRATLLPERLHAPLKQQLLRVAGQHKQDLSRGAGLAPLPSALALSLGLDFAGLAVRVSLRYCARGVKVAGWRAGMRRIRRYSAPFGTPGIGQGSTSMRVCTRYVIPLPRICWRQEPTSGRYSCCSVTAVCRRR